MLLVIDESGDTALDIAAEQNPWFVVGGVLFDSRDDAAACRAVLTDLRHRLGGGEFHFSKNTPHRRRAVLEGLSAVPFRFYAVACDKTRLDRNRWRKPTDLYAEVSRRMVESVAPNLVGCSIWFDTLGGGKADNAHAKRLQRVAGKIDDKSRVKNCRACDSKREALIQVADYVCGAVAQSVRGDSEYRRLMRRCEGMVIEWPAKEVETESGR